MTRKEEIKKEYLKALKDMIEEALHYDENTILKDFYEKYNITEDEFKWLDNLEIEVKEK